MDKAIKDYLLEILTEMGQMDHIGAQIKCGKCENKIIHTQNGVMKMPTDRRSDLIARGWEFIEAENKAKGF
jgi:bacterioferritin-associated ferredoxin